MESCDGAFSYLAGGAITDDARLLQAREFGVVQPQDFGEDVMVVLTEQRAYAMNRRIRAVDTYRQRGIRMPARVLVIDLLEESGRLQLRIVKMLGRRANGRRWNPAALEFAAQLFLVLRRGPFRDEVVETGAVGMALERSRELFAARPLRASHHVEQRAPL